MRSRNRKYRSWKSFTFGAVSGLAATVAMTQFHKVWTQLSKDENKVARANSAEEEKEDSTMKAAGGISRAIGHSLSREQRRKAGTWIHYGFGTALGGVFGLATETGSRWLSAKNPILTGTVYGSLVFVAAHEIAVPALKLSSNPLKEPISDQIAELVSHLVYGVGTEIAYEVLEKLKD